MDKISHVLPLKVEWEILSIPPISDQNLEADPISPNPYFGFPSASITIGVIPCFASIDITLDLSPTNNHTK